MTTLEYEQGERKKGGSGHNITKKKGMSNDQSLSHEQVTYPIV